jgi:hypothetical protein
MTAAASFPDAVYLTKLKRFRSLEEWIFDAEGSISLN